MPVLVDPRAGSGPLLGMIKAHHVPVEQAKLSFADFAFLGRGDHEEPVPVGVERKTLDDFIKSMHDGRLPGHQLPGMLGCYQDVWLVVEGIWREDEETGHVLVPAGKKKGKAVWKDLATGKAHALMAGELEGMMLTLQLKGGVRLKEVKNQKATARFVARLYKWYTNKEWAGHRSHLKFHTEQADRALLTKPTLCREIAARLPGIGWVKSDEVAKRFGSVAAMVNAEDREWAEIKGIGKPMASKIVEAIQVANWTG